MHCHSRPVEDKVRGCSCSRKQGPPQQAGDRSVEACLPACGRHTSPLLPPRISYFLCLHRRSGDTVSLPQPGISHPLLALTSQLQPLPVPPHPHLCPGLTPTVMVTFTKVLSCGTPWSYTSTVTTICPRSSSKASRSSGSLLCISPVTSLMVKLLLNGPGKILKPTLLLGLPGSSLSMACKGHGLEQGCPAPWGQSLLLSNSLAFSTLPLSVHTWICVLTFCPSSTEMKYEPMTMGVMSLSSSTVISSKVVPTRLPPSLAWRLA